MLGSDRRRIAWLAAALCGLTFTACGGDDGDQGEPVGPAAGAHAGLEHIHGLGVAADTLFIATHTGLWASPEGESTARRVGSSQQDIMGFSVATEDRFIGSGHPAPDQELPPNLGLIESHDGGESWEPVSLMGEADFHVLEAAGEQVYGYDGTQGRLMVSDDGGRDWTERSPPGATFSLAIDPADPSRTVAVTERGVFASRDEGRRWRRLRDDLAGLLAWPLQQRLYLVDVTGQVHVSEDAGSAWEPAGSVGGEPVALTSHGDDLYAALADGTVKHSADGGASWTVRVTP